MTEDRIQIVEVGARDGLQNESAVLDTADKLNLINRVAAAGVGRVEVASFVHPRLVPQMADAEDVVAGLPDRSGYSKIGLVLNRRGLERALQTGIDEVNLVVAASEGFSQANQNATVSDTLKAIEEMIPAIRRAGLRSTVTISVAFGCPFEGEVPIGAMTGVAGRAAASGADEIALGDTIGVAVPSDVTERIAALRSVIGDTPLRCHFHDTRNTGVANVVAAVDSGVQIVDASIGGTGGCPYAPKATGNVATEDVVYTLHRMGLETGIDLDRLIETGRWLGRKLGKRLPSALGRAGGWPPRPSQGETRSDR